MALLVWDNRKLVLGDLHKKSLAALLNLGLT